ncbi:MAG: CoA-binding protein [Caldisericia bacterium]|nr:CoA-binding protein [Caldisericia bacterium]
MSNLEMLKSAKVIAVLGFSTNPSKASNRIARFLIDAGYTVYLVNPNYAGESFLETKIIAKLSQIQEHIDIVDVFIKSESVQNLIDEMISAKPATVWFQPGISCPESELKLINAGIRVISNKCIMQELG